MRLALDWPMSWTTRIGTDGPVGVSPCGKVELSTSPLVARAEFTPLAAIERDAPPGATRTYLQVFPHATRDGWPMKVVALQLAGSKPTHVELRLGAAYEIVYYGAVAVARSRDLDAYEQWRSEILAAFTSARPLLQPDEPVTIAELWSMDDA